VMSWPMRAAVAAAVNRSSITTQANISTAQAMSSGCWSHADGEGCSAAGLGAGAVADVDLEAGEQRRQLAARQQESRFSAIVPGVSWSLST
jgi:hypothetical protein